VALPESHRIVGVGHGDAAISTSSTSLLLSGWSTLEAAQKCGQVRARFVTNVAAFLHDQGRDILNVVDEPAKSRGGCYVKLAVYDGNQDAISSYRHLGFELREDERALILRDL